MEAKHKLIIAAIVGACLLSGGASYMIYRDVQAKHYIKEANQFIQANQYTEARQSAEKALKFSAQKATDTFNQTVALQKSQQAFEQAQTHEKSNQWQEAIQQYALVVQEDKHHFTKAKGRMAEILLEQAKAAYQKKSFEEAHTYLLRSLDIDAYFEEALKRKKDYAYAAEKQRFERSEKQYQQVLQQAEKLNIVQAIEKLTEYSNQKHPDVLVKKAQQQIKSLNNQQAVLLKKIEHLKANNRYSQAIDQLKNTRLVPPEKQKSLIKTIEEERAAYIKRQEELKQERHQNAYEIAMQMVRENLRSPSSARFSDTYWVTEDNHPNYKIMVEVEAQNAFGAYLREFYLTCFTVKDGGSRFTYNSRLAVQELGSTESEARRLLGFAKAICD